MKAVASFHIWCVAPLSIITGYSDVEFREALLQIIFWGNVKHYKWWNPMTWILDVSCPLGDEASQFPFG